MATLDLKTAQEMVDHYAITRKKLIDSTYGINDTLGIWYSVAQLKNFVASLSDDATGVRLYLAAYADDSNLYPDQTTIVAIETVGDQLGRNIDKLGSYLRRGNDGEGDGGHDGGHGGGHGGHGGHGGGHGGYGGGGDPYNHGILCPPNTDCA